MQLWYKTKQISGHFAEYRKKNKEKINQRKRISYKKHKEKIKQKSKKYREENRLKIRTYHKKYYQKNKENLRKRHREYQRKNRDVLAEYHRAYARKNGKKQREELNDTYIKILLGYHNVPKSLIEIKKLQIKINRYLKSNKYV